jgi:polar amino acid transport system substrate-binding protein
VTLIKVKHYFWIVFLSCVMLSQFALAETPITVLYTERAPFMKKQADGTLTGFAATPVILAFSKAAIPFEIKEASPARRLLEVKENKTRVCSIGFYKNAERMRYARFSNPVSQDGIIVGLANLKLTSTKSVTVDAILDRQDLNILLKKDIFYGPFLESKFAKMKAHRIASTAEFAQLIRLIKLDRAQLIFLPEEEATFYLKEFGYSTSDFNLIRFPEMPPGEFRYIMCSLQVEESVIAKLNKAIGELKH